MARKKKETQMEPTNGTDTQVMNPPGDQTPDEGSPEKRKPVATFKCSSSKDTFIEVAVWQNDVTYQDGNTGKQYVTSFTRSYKNGDGWKTNYSYRQHDLPILMFLLQKAHAWMLDQRATVDVPF